MLRSLRADELTWNGELDGNDSHMGYWQRELIRAHMKRKCNGKAFGKSWVNLFGLGIGRTTIANGQYQFLKNNFHVKWRPGHRPQYLTDGSPFKNDSAVQVPSMAYPKFANLVTNSDGFLPFNHRDEMEPFTAQIVLGAIKDAQHIQ
jgi:hypothetical protein